LALVSWASHNKVAVLEQNIGEASDGADDGTMLGDSEGKLLGWVDGEEIGSMLILGSKLGRSEGFIDSDGAKLGLSDGVAVGASVGSDDGIELGGWEGKLLGWVDGKDDGSILMLGSKLGRSEGLSDNDGAKLGLFDGISVGACVGSDDGIELGGWEGKLLGCDDGKEAGSILMLGSKLGRSEGFIDSEGEKLRLLDGVPVGELLGTPDGTSDGADEGLFDSVVVG
jgi:hypothetical protein